MLKQFNQSRGNCRDSSTTERGAQHTRKMPTEANTRAYDLNQKTMQALDTLAEEYELFEETMRKVTHETEEADMLYAVASEVGEELDRTQKDQERLQDELEFTCEGMVTASKEITNCWALHKAACANVNNTSAKLSAFREVSNRRATHEATAEVKKASQRTADLKRKATEAHEKTRSPSALQENHQRAHKIRSSCEQQLGIPGQVHKRNSCRHPLGVPDRESNEIRYLKQVTELIEER